MNDWKVSSEWEALSLHACQDENKHCIMYIHVIYVIDLFSLEFLHCQYVTY